MLNSHHDPALASLSVVVACIAAYAALQLAGRVVVATGWSRSLWLVGSGFTMGVGIWSMHFVAMLAFRLPIPVSYTIDLVLLSVAVAIAASFLAFIIVSRPAPTLPVLVVASLFMGPAIAGMHYIGMASMWMAARIDYHAGLVAASVVIAVTASLAALRLSVAFRTEVPRPAWHKPASAVLMGVAICGMHYTGMMAAEFIPAPAPAVMGRRILATDGLAYAVGVAATFVAGVALIAVLLDRSLRAKIAEAEALRVGEERLRRSEERLRFALTAARMTTWEVDLDSGVVFLSQDGGDDAAAAKALDGFLARVHRDDRRAFEEALKRAHVEGTFDIDFRLTDHQGRDRWFNAKGQRRTSGVREGHHNRIIGISVDITERRQLEEQLRQAQKMEAIGQLAGGVAHDFNNLLTIIRGNAELALEPGRHDPRDAMREVLEAGDRAAALTQQLLAFSRREVVQPRPLDINDVITQIEPMLRRLIGEDVTIVIDPAPAPRLTMADRGHVEQILLNLAVNARDAMPVGGHLRIETGAATVSPQDAVRAGMVPGDYVTLTVSDTGVGIDPAIVGRIFEPFFTTKEAGKGTGLGLSTVYGIVRQSGGYVFVHSRPGETAFKVYLPEVSGSVEATPAAPPAAMAQKGSETLLLVEDEAALRRLARQILERKGYRVLEAEHGMHALEVAQQHDGRIDALVTDVVMPKLGGRELADQLRKLRPGIKVLFISGYTDDDTLRRGRLDPGTAFVPKPFAPAALAAAVRETLDAPSEDRG
jgi:NO-binding membrane sensor protein with MHYT domain/nitrogen-specific signal transduction histidine kinase/CheY-like chemotaxis protein